MHHNTGKAKSGKVCPLCGKTNTLSMTTMAIQILKIVGYPIEKSIYTPGSFNRFEMEAIYNFVLSIHEAK